MVRAAASLPNGLYSEQREGTPVGVFVSRRNAVDAIIAVERLRDHVSPHLMINERRTIDADELWMSPCYKRLSLAIHFTWRRIGNR